MKILFGYPGWGWRMFGLASFTKGRTWFLGFSRELPPSAHNQMCASELAVRVERGESWRIADEERRDGGC